MIHKKIIISIFFFIFFSNLCSHLKADNSENYILVSVNNIKIIDGDTMRIGKNKIRLHGIDSPEIKQKCKKTSGESYFCGNIAKNKLTDLISENNIKCAIHGKDKYKRLIATCYTKQININDFMVREGWALAYRKYSDAYILSEEYAKINKKGLWGGSFVSPWRWRSKNR